MHCVCQGLKAQLETCAVLSSSFIHPLFSQFACFTEKMHRGKNKTSPFMSTPCLWILHRVPEVIFSLLQRTDWLLEESERMLHSCVVRNAQTVGLWVKEMSMAGGLDLARPPVYVGAILEQVLLSEYWEKQ